MSNMKKLIESIDRFEFAGEKVGQRPGEQWRGNDPNPPGTKLVGEDPDKFLGEPYIREEENGFDEYDNEYGWLDNGDYVEDTQDGSGEIFRLSQYEPGCRRCRISDEQGRGWYISPSRLKKVDDNQRIFRFFGSELNNDDDEDFEDNLTEELKAQFEDYVNNEKYDPDKLYPPTSKKPAADKKKPKVTKNKPSNELTENKAAQLAALRMRMADIHRRLGETKKALRRSGGQSLKEEPLDQAVQPQQNTASSTTGTQPPLKPGQAQTPAQQAPAPAGTQTAQAALGQPTLPAAGQPGGAPTSLPPGSPKPPSGTASNAATTPLQTITSTVAQLANDPAAAKQVAMKLNNIR
jgi:hypothetical protein